jgi:hypothetical protein
MARRYIDFISAYCDHWCERCAFTERCANYAVSSALAMCDGNEVAALELVLGPPRVPGAPPRKTVGERMAEALGDCEPDQRELDAIGRELDEREQRIRRIGVAQASLDYAIASQRWLKAYRRAENENDTALRDAIETIGWDASLIHVKIMRALDGRDDHAGGSWFEERGVEASWNGSAKVALISIERSEQAWRIVAASTADQAAGVLAAFLARLRIEVGNEFPDAMAFKRPGFDDGRPAKR